MTSLPLAYSSITRPDTISSIPVLTFNLKMQIFLHSAANALLSQKAVLDEFTSSPFLLLYVSPPPLSHSCVNLYVTTAHFLDSEANALLRQKTILDDFTSSRFLLLYPYPPPLSHSCVNL